jgi:hypothetical protein
VATLGYGDITPSTAAETAVDCFLVAFGVLMFGIIMGSIAEQVANSSREARQAQVSWLGFGCRWRVRGGWGRLHPYWKLPGGRNMASSGAGRGCMPGDISQEALQV